jgi:hypothetical protein
MNLDGKFIKRTSKSKQNKKVVKIKLRKIIPFLLISFITSPELTTIWNGDDNNLSHLKRREKLIKFP